MRFEQINYFVTAVELGSISGTAKFLNITHQSVSKSIQLLEDELKTKLLYRGKEGVSLTEKGTVIYKYCKEILELEKQIHDSCADKKKRKFLNVLVENSFINYGEYYLKKYCVEDAEYNIDYKEPKYINERILTDEETEYDAFLTMLSTEKYLKIKDELERRYDVYICLQEPICLIGYRKLLQKKEANKEDLKDLKFIFYQDSIKYGNYYLSILQEENQITFNNISFTNSSSKIISKMSGENCFTLGTQIGYRNTNTANNYDLIEIKPEIYVSHLLLKNKEIDK